MWVTYASEAAPGCVNEDHVVAGPTWWAVLDGATLRPDVDCGCSHNPAWLARRLGGALAERLSAGAGEPLPDLLAESIKAVCDAHAATCDLSNPDSPSSTAAILRLHDGRLDWLVLADSPLLLDVDGTVRTIVDDRTARLPSYTVEAVRNARNSPGGFWVASTKPEAAYEALTGSMEVSRVRRAALLSDGAARLVERFGFLDWQDLLDLLEADGPAALIGRTRTAEYNESANGQRKYRGKAHDDTTAIMICFHRRGRTEP